ncbi:hypothetical protein [Ramlibacter tataouinensis]|uniref:Uncharacterized protein n=1 Tax=Ramlibacter tataouinensis (strain ATCC BAA-407 / DSM 14655 / LMG 21543 / TTB310) TaxID=365046 RepID=F5XZT5_RAMTT|nr:hypothetical protein [Ramlibacter tataouinensis]AEG93296.1 Conserved hypothetical protein [Ramlibacter tataouinensis TTB310]
MAIALLHFTALLAPLHQLAGWFFGDGPAVARHRPASLRPHGVAPVRSVHGMRAQRACRPLRVVRVVEAHRPVGAGRMVISGRMADVCAELDRLAELEARH